MKAKLLTALLAGIAAAFFLAILQAWIVTPLILQAEEYEQAPAEQTQQDHHAASHGHHGVAHDHHDESAWAPADGWQRSLATLSANLVMGCGFGLMLVAGYSFKAPASGWHGLAWGGAGFLVVFALPSLGLPPELPGTESASLESRQLWWCAAVLCGTLGMALLVFASHWFVRVLGLGVVAIPHGIGAPALDVHSALAPAALQATFELATASANVVFWLILGGVSAALYRRWCWVDEADVAAEYSA